MPKSHKEWQLSLFDLIAERDNIFQHIFDFQVYFYFFFPIKNKMIVLIRQQLKLVWPNAEMCVLLCSVCDYSSTMIISTIFVS